MLENLLQILQDNAIWVVAFLILVTVIILARMHRQVKRLNKNLGLITQNIQEYFDVIMMEEEESQSQIRTRKREDIFLTKEERDMLLSNDPKVRDPKQDEEVFNAVMQEYFP
jgi:uncharacterized membrane protein YhiD involved in acid resistance